MTPRALRSLFRRALVLAAASACSPYGLQGNSFAVVPSSQDGTKLQPKLDERGDLPPDVCAKACIPEGDSRTSVRSCHPGTFIAADAPDAADAPVIVCDTFYSTGGSSSILGPLPSGRAPAGLLAARPSRSPDVVGQYLAEVAHLEAASVIAFRRLARDLADHGAPRGLRQRALAAARDEVRHARAARRLARARAVSVPRLRVRALEARSLEAIARENLVEGCVRETYAALVAGHQALHAADPSIRTMMRRIARDEERHAALAWTIHRFALARLDRAARARLLRAQRAAERNLERDLEQTLARTRAPVARALGLPPTPRLLARALAQVLRDRGG